MGDRRIKIVVIRMNNIKVERKNRRIWTRVW